MSITGILKYLGLKKQTKEPFAWVLATTYKKENGIVTSPSYSIAHTNTMYYLDDSALLDAEQYVYRLKKHIEELKGTNTGWNGNGWASVEQEIFPLYK